MLSLSCISTEHNVVSWKELRKAQRRREKSWIVQSMSSEGSATLRSFIDLVFTKQEATANGDIRISFFSSRPREKWERWDPCAEWAKDRSPPAGCPPACAGGRFSLAYMFFLGCYFWACGTRGCRECSRFHFVECWQGGISLHGAGGWKEDQLWPWRVKRRAEEGAVQGRQPLM